MPNPPHAEPITSGRGRDCNVQAFAAHASNSGNRITLMTLTSE